MQCLFKNFVRLYEDKLDEVDKQRETLGTSVEDVQKMKIDLLRSYVNDLGQQNLSLIETAEELREACETRVALLEGLLKKTTVVSKEYTKKITEYEREFQANDIKKLKASSLLQLLQNKCQVLEEERNFVREEAVVLGQDVSSLMQLIAHSRNVGSWEKSSNGDIESEIQFGLDRLSEVYLPKYSSNEALNERDHSIYSDDYCRSLTTYYSEFPRKASPSFSTDCLELRSERLTEKDILIKRLQVDLKYSQKAQSNSSLQLLQKDRSIADLQCQITQLKHELSVKEQECNSYFRDLQLRQDLQQIANMECSRYEEQIKRMEVELDVLHNGEKKNVTTSLLRQKEHDQVDGNSSSSSPANFNVHVEEGGGDKTDSVMHKSPSLCHRCICSAIRREDVAVSCNLSSDASVKCNSLSSLQNELTQLDLAFHNSEKECDSLRQLVVSGTEKIGTLEKTLEDTFEQLKSAKQDESVSEEGQTKLIEDLKTLEADRDSLVLEVSKLKEDIHSSELSAHDTRIVLAKEIAERHDTIKSLRNELIEQAEHHKEIVQQLFMKTEIIRELRKELKTAQNKANGNNGRNDNVEALRQQIETQQKELENQKITIRNLQDALVQSKRTNHNPPSIAVTNGSNVNHSNHSQSKPSRSSSSTHEVFDV